MNVLTVIMLFSFVQLVNTDTNADRYLLQGLELEQQGKPELALQHWQHAISELEVPSVAIATEFLRVVTQYKLRDYYPSASDHYRWGLSGYNPAAMQVNRKPLEEEISRMEPLLEQSVHRHWTRLLEANSPMLLEEIMQFWDRLNIRPSTPFNERLIEHWERIAYAREHYTKRSDPPFDTDARGLFYVKYGQADYKETGRVDVTQDKLNWILEQFNPSTEENASNNYELMLVSNSISNLVLNPQYELWIYDSPDEEMEHNLVLIFGHRSGGRFDRLEVLEDFIPVSAFNSITVLQRSDANPAVPIISPGMVLQLIYYEHFYSKDPFFAQLYYNLNFDAFRNGMGRLPDPLMVGTLRNRNIQQSNRLAMQAPDEFSTEEKKIPEIPIEVYQYRLLDVSNRPILATFVESYPNNAFINDFIHNEESLTSNVNGSIDLSDNIYDWYQLIHGLQLRSSQWDLLGQTRQFPQIIVDPYEEIPSSSVLLVPWNELTGTQVFYAELINIHPDTGPRMESLFPESLRGLGKLEINQPEPLTVRDGELVVGDIILGYRKIEVEPDEEILFNFTPANNRRIAEGENFVIHFEVYQLQLDQEGISRFEVEYEIRPERRFLSRNRSQTDQFRVTLSFEHDSYRFAESLEIETVGIDAGKYELRWIVRDIQSGQNHEQMVQFEVVESTDNSKVE